MGSSRSSRHEENLIPRITAAVYPSFALLAGMQLDLFTPLNDGRMSAEQIAAIMSKSVLQTAYRVVGVAPYRCSSRPNHQVTH